MSSIEIQLHSRICSSHTKHKLMSRIIVLTEKIHNHQRNTYLCSDTPVKRILGSTQLYFTDDNSALLELANQIQMKPSLEIDRLAANLFGNFFLDKLSSL